jgi:hypothetical protein
MHIEILSPDQASLLRFVKRFRRNFFLVGGTAIALQIGHRRSYDFDLFSKKPLNLKLLERTIRLSELPVNDVKVKRSHEYTLVIKNIKFTFYHYLYPAVEALIDFNGIIKMPPLLQLAAMKAHALGGRAKWRDYVDLYFLLKNYFTLRKIVDEAKRLFHGEFNERLFRQQLCFFNDVDYREKVEYMGDSVPEDQIKKFLSDVGLS